MMIWRKKSVQKVENSQKEENPQSWLDSYSSVVSHLGNNAVGIASRASTIFVGGDFSGDDVGEGIHLIFVVM